MPSKVDLIKRCLDNTAPPEKFEDLGILFFAREFLSACRGSKQAKIHYDMMINALSLFDPLKVNKTQRQVYITVFREAAKSTYFSFAFPLYIANTTGGTINVRRNAEGYDGADIHNYDIFTYTVKPEFVEIFSETHSAAERFTMNIRNELEQNKYLHHVFGNKSPQNVADDRQNVWRRDVFMLKNGNIIYGNGSGQQSRGMLISGRRPTLAIFDDMYSRKNTMTEESREKLRYFFFAEALNSVDTVEGKAILVGTILHEDTVFSDVKKSSAWTGFSYPAICKAELDEALSYCKIDNETRSFILPSPDVIEMLEKKFTSIAWKARQGLYYLLSMYMEHYEMSRTSYFYQEKLNIVTSPEDQMFTENMVRFTEVQTFRENGHVWVKFNYNTYSWVGMIDPIIGIDLASSEMAKSDNTAIVVAGNVIAYPQLRDLDYKAGQHVIHKKNGIKCVVVIKSFIGKTDIYDNPTNQKMGLNPIVLSYCQKYGVNKIAFEVAGQQGLIARELQRHLRELGTNVMVIEVPVSNQSRKEERISSILGPIMQSSQITIMNEDAQSHLIWHQLSHLGFAEHDDGADALSTGMLHAKPGRSVDYQAYAETFIASRIDSVSGRDYRDKSSFVNNWYA